MLRKFYKFSNKVKFSRSNVFLRDMFTCQYCKDVFEKKDLTIDHLIPKSKGGVTSWENVTTSCKSCNLKKADNIPEKLPIAEKPSFRDLIKGEQLASGKSISIDWQEYIVA
jgi:5-methylcytosine-specific restriction endonuclease McrA